MELVTLYSEVLQSQLLEKNKNKTIKRTREEWIPFLESESHSIAVYAGRGTGKTHNTVTRVLLSDHDCIVFCNSDYERRILCRDIDFRWENECLHKNRAIEVLNINSSLSDHILFDLKGKEVIFHEFDSPKFCRYVELYRDILSLAAHVVCVGSINGLDKNLSAKQWFRESESNYFIDSNVYRSNFSMPEMFPSEFHGFINQLPPSRYEFNFNNFSLEF
ncbi:hypothetical protein P4478_05585 [Bacillus subtilis]|nr:hypothetical protein [Bacillus subtilis]